MKLKAIDSMSAAKVIGGIYAGVGLVLGALFSLLSLFGAGFAIATGEQAFFGMVMGVGAIVVLPILYGIGGAIGAFVFTLVYNFIAGRFGGIELELE